MNSTKYKTWKSEIDLKTCIQCKNLHGKIYLLDERAEPYPPLHPNCRCVIDYLKAIFAGLATNNGKEGADWWLKNYGKLPPYYITSKSAKENGWNPKKGDLDEVLPNTMIFGGAYQNKNGHLPSLPERTWYEADINYSWGWRGAERILFSDDGLIFVTYDHYQTFHEII